MTSILKPELSDKIASFCGNVYRRRLIKDLEDLSETYSIFVVAFDEYLKVPVINVIAECHVIGIILHRSFPFKPPTIELNGEPYSKILVYANNERKAALKELKNIDCLCCESIACEGNWTIQTRLKGIVDEVLKNIKINKELDDYISNKNNNNNKNNTDEINVSSDSNKKRKIH